MSPGPDSNVTFSVQTPRVSILIPNFNNGRASSRDGETDLIADLLVSLRDTLADDPTPHEIIAYDDGSTDDSLDTLRQWAAQGFLKLIEDSHTGVLARHANLLVNASRGEYLVRLDGDIVVLTPQWVRKLCAVFENAPPEVGVIGPKQLGPDPRWIHSFGDFILHPRGYHHLHQGAARDSVTRAAEVDHVMGCFYCCKREVHDRLGGYDEDILRGQTIEFGLRARLEGFRCFAIPNIEFIHRHSLRRQRANTADTTVGIDDARHAFKRKWGFDRIAPDLDTARQRYAHTPLLWNAEVFGLPRDEAYRMAAGPEPTVETSSWARYAKDEWFQRQTTFRLEVITRLTSQYGPGAKVAIVGVGDGLLAHLAAAAGLEVHACAMTQEHIDLAQQFTRQQKYPAATADPRKVPGGGARLVVQSAPPKLPWGDALFDAVVWPWGVDQHPNPAGQFAEILRVMKTTAMFAVVAPHGSYLPHELGTLVRASADWIVAKPPPTLADDKPAVVLAAPSEAVFRSSSRAA